MKNKVAIVTGASRGIGAAIVRELSKEGVKVVINYFPNEFEEEAEQNATTLATEITNNSNEVSTFKADIRNEESVKNLIDFTLRKYGQLDFVINNAGIVYDREWQDKTEDEWLNTFKTNVLSHFFMIKYAEKFLRESTQGRVVNISSTNATKAYSSFSMDYDVSKAGVLNLSHNMSKILAPSVTVNTVLPGWVNTDMNKTLPDAYAEVETKKISKGRFAEPEEVAKVVKFLCSEDAGYINGAEIVVDGGWKY